MARHYVKNPVKSAPVDDQVLTEARTKADAAAARLREAERGDPLAAGWDVEYESASAAVRAAGRRLDALEALRAAQVERNGERAAAVKSAQKDLASAATALATSRDQVAAAASTHLQSLAAVAVAEQAHNALVAQSRARGAELGLRTKDDLVDGDAEHAEGVLDNGLRAGGTDWTPLPPGAVAAHALRLVYRDCGPLHPLSAIGQYRWRPHEVESRPDGLRIPSLADAGAVAPEAPQRVAARSTPLADVLPPREAASGDVSGFVRAPRHERKTL